MQIVVYILILALLFWWIFKASFFRIDSIKGWILPSIFLFKVGVSFVFYFIYTRYYNPIDADIIRFFRDGEILNGVARTNPGIFFKLIFTNDLENPELYAVAELMNNWDIGYKSILWSNSRFLIIYHTLVRFISFGNIHLHSLIAVFIGFVGQVALFKAFIMYLKDKKYLLLIVVFLLPSVVFWTSSVIKEPFILFCLGLLLYNALKLFQTGNLYRIITMAIAAFFLLAIRVNDFVVFSFLFIPFLLVKRFPRYSFLKYLSFVLFGFMISIAHYTFSPRKSVFHATAKKHNAYIDIAKEKESSSLITKEYLVPDPLDYLKNAPKALLNAFFRPHLFEADTLLKKITALENVFVFAFIIVLLLFRKKSVYGLNLFWFIFFFALLNLVVIGLLIPVSGAIVRYKIIGIPILLTALLFVFDKTKFKLFFKKQDVLS